MNTPALKRPYFAHQINGYSTALERSVEALAADFFGIPQKYDESIGAGIENPNQKHHQEAVKVLSKRARLADTNHKGMNHFFDVVLPGCDSGFAWPYLDGRMGLGVAGEIKWLLERDRPVFLVYLTREPTDAELRAFEKDHRSGLYAIRQFTDDEKAMLLAHDPKAVDETKVGREILPWEKLVLPHLETRLRTWNVYNTPPMRPYETAHLATMPLPPGFYPDEKK
jgi:hypothetical protein